MARAFAVGALLLTACAPDTPRPVTRITNPEPQVSPGPSPQPTRLATTSEPMTPGTSSPDPEAVPTHTRPAPVRAQPSGRTVVSTAYCEHGLTASGQHTHPGIVAMNGVPFGSKWRVLTGPKAGVVLVVADRWGSGTQFDIWLPSCAEARAYGRRTIGVERVA